jgi:NDP-mannose synthase
MKHAVILAGGRGTRLRPYTLTLPKPLVPLVDTPIVEIVIRKQANAGYDGATLAINHMGDLIQAYFGSGERWGFGDDCSASTDRRSPGQLSGHQRGRVE